jgi:hypothetical protein
MKKPAGKKRAAKRTARVAEDDLRPEYDFSNAKPNPYAARFKGGTTVVVLDPDVAESFPDAAAVNDALRALARIAHKPGKKTSSRRRTA